jgi:hypothetical protein
MPLRGRRPRSRGQALVEFSLVLIPFLFLLLGIVDLGRGIYTNNAVAQAAREIARTTSVHPCAGGFPCATFGNSTETQATIATQRTMVPALGTPVITCVDLADAAPTGSGGAPRTCRPGDFARVTVSVPFSVITPLLSAIAPTTLTSTSHVQIP